MGFTGKHVFVFGDTTGIAFGIADNVAKYGVNVSVASRNQENLDAATASLRTAGGNIVDADVRDLDAGSRAFHIAARPTWRHRRAGLGRPDLVAAVNAQSSDGFRVFAISTDLARPDRRHQRQAPCGLPQQEQTAIAAVPMRRLGTPDYIEPRRCSWPPLRELPLGALIPCDGGGAIHSVRRRSEPQEIGSRARASQMILARRQCRRSSLEGASPRYRPLPLLPPLSCPFIRWPRRAC